MLDFIKAAKTLTVEEVMSLADEDGNVTLSNAYRLVELPDGLTIEGNLTIEYAKVIRTLPNTLKVYGKLEIWKCEELRNLGVRDVSVDSYLAGEDVSVHGCMDFNTLYEGATLGGNVLMWDCPSLKEISRSVTMGGNTLLEGSTPIPHGVTHRPCGQVYIR